MAFVYKDRAKQTITRAKQTDSTFYLDAPPTGYQNLPYDDTEQDQFDFDYAIVCADGRWQTGQAYLGYDIGEDCYVLQLNVGKVYDNSDGDTSNIAANFGFDTNNAEVFNIVSAHRMNMPDTAGDILVDVAYGSGSDYIEIPDSTGGPESYAFTLEMPWPQRACPIDLAQVDITVVLRRYGGVWAAWEMRGVVYNDGGTPVIDVTPTAVIGAGNGVSLAVAMNDIDIDFTFSANGQSEINADLGVMCFAKNIHNQRSCW